MRPSLAVIGLAALLALIGCSGDDGSDGSPADPDAQSGTGQPTATPMPAERIQQILDDARLSEKELGLAVDETYRRESGLETATFAYCGDEADPVDDLRIARTQRWWANAQWPKVVDGGYKVGVEIVYYEAGGVDETMAAFAAIPDTCPSAEYSSGASATFSSTDPPDGLPEGTVALSDQWTYPEGDTAPGYVVAIPAGDVIGFLYIRGQQTTVDARVGELAQTFAKSVEDASAQLDQLSL